VLFLNGIPIFTAELKNPLTGQTVEHAIRQYKTDRDPREPLLSYGRCLAHFAVDPDLVYVTTQLAGPKTRFLPFNQGKFGGAGNPPVPPTRKGYATAYLWEAAWSKGSVLDLVRQFIHEVEEEDEKGRKTGRRFLIFPRYQQLDAVRKLVADARSRGAGQRYLIQHSAGSGKSFTIAWLAHQLSTLHDATDRRVFDSIIVITDRRILDRQLQTTMRQFEQTLGVVENIDTTSRQLKEALEAGKTIIVTTLQKFPVIAKEIGELPGKRFALIVDEAHSSQSGESTKSMKAVLASGSLEQAEAEEAGAETPEEELESAILAEMASRAAAESLDLRLHRDAEAEDARAVRQEARRREVRAVPPVQHAAGDRGGLHPRRARELHHLQGLLAPAQEGRGRPALRQEEGPVPAEVVRGSAPARDRREGTDHGRALRRRCRARSPARRRP
jgi:type I restriction enzyme R subunit